MVTGTPRPSRACTKKHAEVIAVPNLDDVIDRLRRLVEELREASEDGTWYKVNDMVEELEGVINELMGMAVRLERQTAKARVGDSRHE
jgi:SpoU rRNA methylase family enzyme